MRPLQALCILAALIPEISVYGDEAVRLPEWIWAGDADTHREATLCRSFSCEQSITEARLQLASEFAACSVTLNGKPIVALDDYGPLLNLDIVQYLKLGNNTIQIRAKSIAGPAAIAASLEIHAGESVSQIDSDASWKAQRSLVVSSGHVVRSSGLILDATASTPLTTTNSGDSPAMNIQPPHQTSSRCPAFEWSCCETPKRAKDHG